MTDLFENTRRYRFGTLAGAQWVFDISVTPAMYDISEKTNPRQNTSMYSRPHFQYHRSYSDEVAILHDINPTKMCR
jgi:hypothetical protein